MFALVLIAVVAGAVAQRVAGLGFGLMVSPVLVVLLGPLDGVMIVNACGAASSLLILSRVWRDVEWGRYVGLIVPGFAGIALGAFIASRVPEAPLEIGIGVALIAGLVVSQIVARARAHVDGLGVMAASGFASGLMNAAAAVGGPAVTAYAILARWDQRRFSATLQPFFITTGTTSIVSKAFATGWHWPALEAWQWGAVLACMLLGIVIGDVLAHRLPGSAVRPAVIGIAYAGAVMAIVNGVGQL